MLDASRAAVSDVYHTIKMYHDTKASVPYRTG